MRYRCASLVIFRNDVHFVKGFQTAGSGHDTSPVLFTVNRRRNVFEIGNTLGHFSTANTLRYP